MPDDLLRYLADFITDRNEDGLSAEEIADVVWMARYLRASASQDLTPAESPVDPDPSPSGHGEAEALDSVIGDAGTEKGGTPRLPPAPAEGIALHLEPPHPAASATGHQATPVRVPAAPVLPAAIEISRALRYLKRHVSRPDSQVLAENATSAVFGETGLILPVFRQGTERWLQVDLIVDSSGSMVLWRDTAAGLLRLLEQQGAFRNVRAWTINSDQPDAGLVPFGRANGIRSTVRCSVDELADPTGRTAILVLTDAVGMGWRTGTMTGCLSTWAQCGPLAIVQVLPRSMWSRTGLNASTVTARMIPGGRPSFRVAHAPGIPVSDALDLPHPLGWVPIVHLSGPWLRPWAEMVSRTGDWLTTIDAMPLYRDAPRSHFASATVEGVAAHELIERFREGASEEAFELAGYLAAAPLSLPVIRWVQHEMIPEAGPQHLAEVFLSGLIMEAEPTAPGGDLDDAIYDFRHGVRELLLDTITQGESLQVLTVLSRVSSAVAARFGGTLDFRALAAGSAGQGDRTLPERSHPFAVIAATVLRGLGGSYGDLAGRLTGAAEALTTTTAPPAELHAPATPPLQDPEEHADQSDSPPPHDPLVVTVHDSPSAEPEYLPIGLLAKPSRLSRPMLFLGLGGTGCQIGVELERRLRDELCGPDGTDLRTTLPDSALLPFQLPPFLQFVYADLNQTELSRARNRVVPTEEHLIAATQTDHFIEKLVPRYRTYPETARNLRANAPDETKAWLPPADGEPRVSPLVLGSGQLPTVGRAALFETFRSGLDGVRQPLREAIGRIAKSGGELAALGSRLEQNCEVFVAFSVAGGTGAGIFYDFIHLVGDAFAREGFTAQIYPLVLMPSAFDEGQGGGRRAALNAGRSLLDLFRLVDDQNARGAATTLVGKPAPRISVRYPGIGEVTLPPTTVQTAFLFSRTAAADREDLHRSVVSFILSLIGANLPNEQENAHADQLYVSFAEQFINQGVDRQVTAYTGIGNQGVSTSLVATLTRPVDDLADIISSRLLARAVDEMATPPRNAEDNQALIQRFCTACGLDRLLAAELELFREPTLPPRGTTGLEQALLARAGAMSSSLTTLEKRLRVVVPQLARDFDYRRGLAESLSSLDAFRLGRVVLGYPWPAEPDDQAGFIGLLASLRNVPSPPTGVTADPPGAEELKRRLPYLRQLQRESPEVQRTLALQDAWYAWRSQAIWHAAWAEQEPVWDRKVSALRAEVNNLVEAFTALARTEPQSFAQRTADLYRPRGGVSFLLPPQDDLDAFYRAVTHWFVARPDLGLRPMSGEAEIASALLGGEGWRHAYQLAIDRGPEHGFDEAVLYVRNQIKQEVKRLFISRSGQQSLLPRLGDLLARAAGSPGPAVTDKDLASFRRQIAGLVPAGFSPQGSGDLRVLVTYPQGATDPQIESYIRSQLNLPRDSNAQVQFRATDTESVVVVMLRTSMSINEVGELREVLRQMTDALHDDQPQDFLAWRQRLSYDDGWLVTTEQDRVHIMQRLLSAMWNDQVKVVGDPRSPDSIEISLPGDRPLSMQLRLEPYGRASSWASLLRSYEESTLVDGSQIRQDFCRKLMTTVPNSLRDPFKEPSELYKWFIDTLAPSQVDLLRAMMQTETTMTKGWVRQLRDFWATTIPEANKQSFHGFQGGGSGSLEGLREDRNG
jgi:hypothetical protein